MIFAKAQLTADYTVTVGAQVTILKVLAPEEGWYSLNAKMNIYYAANNSTGVCVLNWLVGSSKILDNTLWEDKSTVAGSDVTLANVVTMIEEPVYLDKGELVEFQVGGATQQPTILGTTYTSKIWIKKL